MVAVKTLREETYEALENFVSEAKTMFGLDHPHILKIHAVCMKEVPYYLVFEYMDKGDLAHFLQENASSSQKRKNPIVVHEHTVSSLSNNPPQLSCEQLADMCRQIASGMDYLSKKNHIHRDLACRNCLVSSPLNIKIGDFGMSQKLYTCDYYRVNGNAVLPIRWMSPEAVVCGKFTNQSDVWSFGVVMWEVWSFAMQPYYGLTNEEVIQLVREGNHLEVPEDCPEMIYEIMTKCWSMDPTCRPSFSELHDMLANYHPSLYASFPSSPIHLPSLPPYTTPFPHFPCTSLPYIPTHPHSLSPTTHSFLHTSLPSLNTHLPSLTPHTSSTNFVASSSLKHVRLC